MKPARGGVGSRIGLPVVLGVILLWSAVPLFWMVLSSFKPTDELTATTPTLSFTPTLPELQRPVLGRQQHRPVHPQL